MRRTPRTIPALALLGALFLGLLGCEREEVPAAPNGGSPAADPSPLPTDPTHPTTGFSGIDSVVAGVDRVLIRWSPASSPNPAAAPFRYRVYGADEPGEQDFSRPLQETGPDTHQITLGGLDRGVPLYCVVRSVDALGREDDNELEWCATPGQVIYVNGAAPTSGDGLTPQTPFQTFGEAARVSVFRNGANVYVAEGRYPEKIFLFNGMMLYGGFDPSFDLQTRDPLKHPTVLESTDAEAVTVVPGENTCGIDGLVLDGSGEGERAIVAEQCSLQLSNVEITGFGGRAIRLRSRPEDESYLTASILRCRIRKNDGEGIQIEGVADVLLAWSEIADNSHEGLEAENLATQPDEKSRITIENCRFRRNGLGAQIKLEAHDAVEEPGRCRVSIKNSTFTGHRDFAVSVDVLYGESSNVDCRVKIEGNRLIGNRKGLHLDGDARATFRIARNTIVDTGEGAGISLTGSSTLPAYRLLNNLILASEGGGVTGLGRGTVIVRYCHLHGNGGPAIALPQAWVHASGSIFEGNSAPSRVNRLAYSIVHGDTVTSSIAPIAVVGEAPSLTAHPVRFLRLGGPSDGGRLPLTSTAGFEVGGTVELAHDGVARTVERVEDDALVVNPPPPSPLAERTLVSDWGRSTTVEIDSAPRGQSAARDAAHPQEKDVDGTRADVGRAGGPLGIARGTRSDRRKDPELAFIFPQPGSLIVEPRWTLGFSEKIGDELPYRLLAAGAPVIGTGRADSRELEIASEPASPGDRRILELPPHEESPPQLWHIELDYTFAAALPGPGGTVRTLPTTGTGVLPPQGSHRLALEIGEGELRGTILIPGQRHVDVLLHQGTSTQQATSVGGAAIDFGPWTVGSTPAELEIRWTPNGEAGPPAPVLYRLDLRGGE